MGSVSIADMERVALGGEPFRGGDDIGNVIELGDLNDDLGLSMLMNPSKMSGSGSSGNESRTVNISSYAPPPQQSSGGSSSGFAGIEVSPLEPLEPISIDAEPFGGSGPEISVMKEGSGGERSGNGSGNGSGERSGVGNGGGGFFGSMFGNSQSATGPSVNLASPARDPEAEKKEKTDLLNKLQRLEQKGFPVNRKYTMDNSLDEIKTEYYRLVDARQLETSLKFQRQMLMGAITGMEWLNGRFDPFDLKLEGWSESVHENIEDFDEIFEELYDKYKDKGKMSPEMRLIMAVGGSGFMCHVSNSFFRSKMPTMDDVLRKNPELARQMAAAAAQQAGPGFGNFMGMAMGVPQGPPSYTGNGGPPPMGPSPSGGIPGGLSGTMPTGPAGAFYSASGAVPSNPMPSQQQAPATATARREMAGPSGVDDILRTFEEVKRAEMAAASMPAQATGYATQPAVAAVMSGAASVISADEFMSQAESVRTGATGNAGGRRRRRQAQPPVGNTVALNV